MNLFTKIVFFLLLLAIFLFEGLGLPRGRETAYYLILATPFFLFLLVYLQRKAIRVPKKVFLLFLLFLLFSAISTVLAVNLQRSFEYLLYYFALFLIFLFAYNYKKELLTPTIILIFTLAFIFTGYSLIIQYVKLPNNLLFLIPTRGYQYVFPFFKSHNPLGAFLLIPLALSLNIFFPLFLVFLLPFLLAYSRSSYLSLGLTLLIFALSKSQLRWKIFSGIIIGVCFILFFATVTYKKPVPIITDINHFLAKNFRLNNKDFLSGRNAYFRSAIFSIKEKPIFGVGPGNFLYITEKYSKYNFAETSENIFLEVFSENGILAGIIFLAIILLILWQGRHSVLFFTFLAMLVLFQTDSSQRFYSYLLLFFCLAGLIYSEEKHISRIDLRFFLVSSIVLLVFCQFMLLNKFFYAKNNYRLAFYNYPLDTFALRLLIYQELRDGNYRNMLGLLEYYKIIAPKDHDNLNFLSLIYLRRGDIITAVRYYHEAQKLIK